MHSRRRRGSSFPSPPGDLSTRSPASSPNSSARSWAARGHRRQQTKWRPQRRRISAVRWSSLKSSSPRRPRAHACDVFALSVFLGAAAGSILRCTRSSLRHAARLRASLAGRQQRRTAGDPAEQPGQGRGRFRPAATKKRVEAAPMGSSGTGSIPPIWQSSSWPIRAAPKAASCPLQGCSAGYHGPDGRPDRRILRRRARAAWTSARRTAQGAGCGFKQATPVFART